MFKAIMRGSLLVAGLVLSLNAVASADSFSVNPGAVGASGPTVPNVNFADFSYVALVNQTATAGTGTFNEQGAGFF